MAENDEAKVCICILTQSNPHYHVVAAASKARRPNTNDASIVLEVGSAPVTAARNGAARRFLEASQNYTHLLCVDDDTLIPPYTVSSLLALDSDVATGFTPICIKGTNEVMLNVAPYSSNSSYMSQSENEHPEPDAMFMRPEWFRRLPEAPCEVGVCGASCLLIRRDVLDAVGFPWFVWQETAFGAYTGEDISFCLRVRELGYSIKADPAVLCGHLKKINLRSFVPTDGPLMAMRNDLKQLPGLGDVNAGR